MILLAIKLVLVVTVCNCSPLQFGFIATDNTTVNELKLPLDIALSVINSDSSILPKYELKTVSWQGQVMLNGKLIYNYYVLIFLTYHNHACSVIKLKR